MPPFRKSFAARTSIKRLVKKKLRLMATRGWGWLTLLVQMGMATEEQAHKAMCRVAQQAIDEEERPAARSFPIPGD